MTRTEILNMQAGRKLNALIGKQFGYIPRIEYWIMNKEETAVTIEFDNKKQADEWLNDNVTRFPQGWIAREGYHVVQVEVWPNFSTDIAYAWQVGIKAGIFTSDYWLHISEVDNKTWCIYEMNMGEAYMTIVDNCETAELAICRAALLTTLELKEGS